MTYYICSGLLHVAMKEKHEFILQDEEHACKITLIADAVVGIGMAVETAKSFIKVEPADDGGMVVKVECSYKLLPVPSVEAQAVQEEIAETTHERIIARDPRDDGSGRRSQQLQSQAGLTIKQREIKKSLLNLALLQFVFIFCIIYRKSL